MPKGKRQPLQQPKTPGVIPLLAAAYYRKVVAFAQQRAHLYDPRLIANFQKWADDLDPPTGT